MTLHQFTIFVAIAKHGNVTKASQELHITQPGVSQQMRLLQEQYGAKLFKRRGRGVELTSAGRRFLAAVSPILQQVKSLSRFSADSTANTEPDRLAVGGSYSLSEILLPSILSSFRKTHPITEIDFRTNNALELERLLLKETIELAVTSNMPSSTRIVAEPFRWERLAFVVSRRHPLARVKNFSLHHLESTPLLVRSSGGRDGNTVIRLKAFTEERGITINIGMRFESPSAIKAAVLNNMGIGLLYEDLVKYNLQRGEFKAIRIKDLKLENQSYITYLQNKPLSDKTAEFLTLLRSSRTDVPKTKEASEYKESGRFVRAANMVFLLNCITASF